MEDVVPAPNIPPKRGDRRRLNLYRLESRPEKEGLAWSPTIRPDFRMPGRFVRRITFSPKVETGSADEIDVP